MRKVNKKLIEFQNKLSFQKKNYLLKINIMRKSLKNNKVKEQYMARKYNLNIFILNVYYN